MVSWGREGITQDQTKDVAWHACWIVRKVLRLSLDEYHSVCYFEALPPREYAATLHAISHRRTFALPLWHVVFVIYYFEFVWKGTFTIDIEC